MAPRVLLQAVRNPQETIQAQEKEKPRASY